MNLETIIGLEIHVQLKTKSKMFCGCSNDGENQPPNTTVCEVCMGHPGVLPVPNKQALEYAIKGALAINCTINQEQHFDRKHYFYPDLPKAYQISQLDRPIGEHGSVEVEVPSEKGRVPIKVGINRLHLEEDAAKNTHPSANSGQVPKMFVDYNRGGTPLVEIVTEPDIKTPLEAKVFLQELRLIMRYIGVSDADMEKGHLRCDANISLRPEGEDKLYPKTEIKNINSFKAVERALEHEIMRQTKLWEAGTPPEKEATRGWDDATGTTKEQRGKEGSADYRYFPEPDIPPIKIGISKTQNTNDKENSNNQNIQLYIEDIRATLPESPQAKRERFMQEYLLSYQDATFLVEDTAFASYFEHVVSEARNVLESLDGVEGDTDEIWQQHGKKLMKLVSGWLINKLGAILIDQKIAWENVPVTPENFAEFVSLIFQGKLNSSSAQTMLQKMVETGGDPSHLLEELGLEQVSDEGELEHIIDTVIKNNPDEVEKYQAGKTELLQFFMGQVMKESKGKANPGTVIPMIQEKLG